LTNKVLIRLPHRQFVFALTKALRPFFRHDRRLFSEVSRLLCDILGEFYHEATGRSLVTGIAVAHQTFGDICQKAERRSRSTYTNAHGRGTMRRCTNSIH